MIFSRDDVGSDRLCSVGFEHVSLRGDHMFGRGESTSNSQKGISPPSQRVIHVWFILVGPLTGLEVMGGIVSLRGNDKEIVDEFGSSAYWGIAKKKGKAKEGQAAGSSFSFRGSAQSFKLLGLVRTGSTCDGFSLISHASHINTSQTLPKKRGQTDISRV